MTTKRVRVVETPENFANTMLIGFPAGTGREAPGSKLMQCVICEAPVYCTPESQRMVAGGATLVCRDCAQAVVDSGEPLSVTKDQLREHIRMKEKNT